MIGNKVYGLQSFNQTESCYAGKANGIQEISYHLSWIRGITGLVEK